MKVTVTIGRVRFYAESHKQAGHSTLGALLRAVQRTKGTSPARTARLRSKRTNLSGGRLVGGNLNYRAPDTGGVGLGREAGGGDAGGAAGRARLLPVTTSCAQRSLKPATNAMPV